MFKKSEITPIGGKSKPRLSLTPILTPYQAEPFQTEKTSKIKQIKEVIHEAATDSTAHSIPHIFKRRNVFLKIFWTLCLLAATGVCAWMISTSIIDYLSYDTVSKTESVLDLPAPFPTVSICNMNSFVTNYSIEFVKKLLTQYQLYQPNSTDLPVSFSFNMLVWKLGIAKFRN